MSIIRAMMLNEENNKMKTQFGNQMISFEEIFQAAKSCCEPVEIARLLKRSEAFTLLTDEQIIKGLKQAGVSLLLAGLVPKYRDKDLDLPRKKKRSL
jgi:hypothetical protein